MLTYSAAWNWTRSTDELSLRLATRRVVDGAAGAVLAFAIFVRVEALGSSKVSLELDVVLERHNILWVVLLGRQERDEGVAAAVRANTHVGRGPVSVGIALVSFILAPSTRLVDRNSGHVNVVLSRSGRSFMLVVVLGIRASERIFLASLGVKWNDLRFGTY